MNSRLWLDLEPLDSAYVRVQNNRFSLEVISCLWEFRTAGAMRKSIIRNAKRDATKAVGNATQADYRAVHAVCDLLNALEDRCKRE